MSKPMALSPVWSNDGFAWDTQMIGKTHMSEAEVEGVDTQIHPFDKCDICEEPYLRHDTRCRFTRFRQGKIFRCKRRAYKHRQDGQLCFNHWKALEDTEALHVQDTLGQEASSTTN